MRDTFLGVGLVEVDVFLLAKGLHEALRDGLNLLGAKKLMLPIAADAVSPGGEGNQCVGDAHMWWRV